MSLDFNNGGIYDPNAGRYRGSDPDAARSFRELNRVMNQLRSDAFIVINGTLPTVGHYTCIVLDGKTNVNGSTAADIAWGIPRGTEVFTAVNILETDGHYVKPPFIVDATRRRHNDGQDTFFFRLSWADVNGTNVTVAGGGTSRVTHGGGDTNITVVITNPTDPIPPDPPLACPADATSCSLYYNVVISNYDGTGTQSWHYKLTRSGSSPIWTVANFADQDADAPSGSSAPTLDCGASYDAGADGYWRLAAGGGNPYLFEAGNGTNCPPTSGYARKYPTPTNCTIAFS